jgi:UrcA family protein
VSRRSRRSTQAATTEKDAARNPIKEDMTMTKTLAIALAATVLATQLAAPIASAEERRSSSDRFGSVKMVSLQVATHDLDPTTVRGAKALYRRILIAAERICLVPLEKRRGLAPMRLVEDAAQCFDAAIDAAVADVRALANVDIEQLAGVDRYADVRLSAVR